MIIFEKAEDLKAYLETQRQGGKRIHFVPTMGALHKGHLSLVNTAKGENALVVVSIFVNPTQFNDKSDFENYPISHKEDVAMLEEAQCNVLYIPPVEEVYPNGYHKPEHYDFGHLDNILEAKHRPGHFHGVGQVVSILLDLIKPDVLYLGQKDYQQCMVIKAMLKMQAGQTKPEIIICPTVREQDGLAMSSRNRRLNEAQRVLAGTIYQCLVSIQAKQKIDPFAIVQKECMDLLKEKGFEPDYVAIAKADNLELLDNYASNEPLIALIAAKIGDVRLIDNIYLN